MIKVTFPNKHCYAIQLFKSGASHAMYPLVTLMLLVNIYKKNKM